MTSIEVRVYSAADPTNLLAVLERTRKRGWNDPLSDVGGGRFEVSARHPKLVADPSILDYGNIVRFALEGTEVFGFIIEAKNLTKAAPGEDGAKWTQVSGRGVMAVLESAVVYPADGLTGSADRDYMDATAGFIFGDLFVEARARGALEGVTRDFDGVFNSQDNPYLVTLDISERAGTDMLQVVQRHADLAVDVYMTPALVLRYFNTRGADRTVGVAPVVFTIGDVATGASVEGKAVIKNSLLVEGPSEYTDRQDDGSVTIYGRREGFLSLGNAKSSAQLTKAADRTLDVQGTPLETVKIPLRWRDGVRPYFDFDVGDRVLAPTSTEERVNQRVVSITVEEDENGVVTTTPELSVRTVEVERRLTRWLKSIGGGALGGVAAGVSSPTVNAGTASSIQAAIDQHVATHPHPDQIGDLADVDTAGVANEDVLTYESGDGQWEPRPAGGVRGAAAWNPPAVTDQHIVSIDVACPGARRGNPAAAGFDQIAVAGWWVFATVIVDDQVHVDLWNRTGATIDLPAGTVTVAAFPA